MPSSNSPTENSLLFPSLLGAAGPPRTVPALRAESLARPRAVPADTSQIVEGPPSRSRVRVGRRELSNITTQLAVMTRSGVDVTTALDSVARQCRRPALRDVLRKVHAAVTDGQAFSQALRQYEAVFGSSYVASVAAGEAAGRLADVLGKLAQFERKSLRLRGTLRTLLTYPVLLCSVASLVILGLILFVLPTFADIFADYGMPLPLVTQILIGVSAEIRAHWWLWGGLAAAGVSGTVAFCRSESGQRLRDHVLLRAAVLRKVSQALLIGRICQLLGLMLQSGVPLLEALGLARLATGNRLYRDLFAELQDDVLNGRGLGDALLSRDFVPPYASEMIATAEKTGKIGSVMELIGEHFEDEGESQLRGLIAVLEPAITVVMGVVVATIVLAVMLPMFELTSFAQQAG